MNYPHDYKAPVWVLPPKIIVAAMAAHIQNIEGIEQEGIKPSDSCLDTINKFLEIRGYKPEFVQVTLHTQPIELECIYSFLFDSEILYLTVDDNSQYFMSRGEF